VSKKHLIAAGLLSAALVAPAAATTVSLAADGQWVGFNVSELDSFSQGVEWIDNANSLDPAFGSQLFFEFTIASGFTGSLTVVDAGFAGDTFLVSNFGSLLGGTSLVPLTSYDTAAYAGLDYAAALADPANFSSATFSLGAGTYRISGYLAQSVQYEGLPLNSTAGALNLTMAPVPEAPALAMMVAGLALVAGLARRRA